MKKTISLLLTFSLFLSIFTLSSPSPTYAAPPVSNSSEFAVTDAELAAAREQFFGGGSLGNNGNFSITSGTERELVLIDDSRIIRKPQVYEIPTPANPNNAPEFVNASLAGPFSVGASRSFFTATHGGTAQPATLMAQGAHTNIWVLNSPGTNAGTITTTIAQNIAARFDPIYTAMTHPTTGFAPFANVRIQAGFGNMPTVGDIAGDGKVNFLLYDIDNDGASTAGYVGGFFTNGDFFTDAGRNGLDMLHMDIGREQGFKMLTSTNEEERLVFYDTMAHEFQHLLYYMYFGVNRPTAGFDSDSWINETLSELAGAFYTSSGRELVSFSRLAAAAGNGHDGSGYRDFLNFSGMKGYGMAKSFGHFLYKRYPNFTRNVYTSMLATYPLAVNNAGIVANRAKMTTMPQAVGDFMRAGTNNSIGTGGQNTMSLLYYLFMESFAADGGVIHTSPTTQSTKIFAPSTAPPNNLWAIRPVMGVTGGRVFVSGTLTGSFYDMSGREAIPTLNSGVAGSIVLQGNGGTTPRGATHERMFRLNGGGAGSPFLRITAPNDGNPETRYYVAVPNDAVTTGASTFSSGANGAALYPLVKGTQMEINTNGRPAYLFVSTIYRNVNSSITYTWSATSNPVGNVTVPPIVPPTTPPPHGGTAVPPGSNTALGDRGVIITGRGETVYVDTNIYSVILPTAAAWDFVLDPKGLLGLPEGQSASPESLAPYAGKILPGDYAPAAINESSFDVVLGIALRLTGDATAVSSAADVHTGTGNNIFLTVEPSANSVSSTVATTFAGSGRQFGLTTIAGNLRFVFDSADYKVHAIGSGSARSYEYRIESGTGKGTQLIVGGECNKNADWLEYNSGTKKVGISAVFSFAPAEAADIALTPVSGVYGLKEYGLAS
jgi:hypothetical protein